MITFKSYTASGEKYFLKSNYNIVLNISFFQVIPGETALAFYTAKNPSDKPVTGISTYNIVPFEAGQYFNKIQCFCFEEQILNAHEQVLMFFISESKNKNGPDICCNNFINNVG